MPIGLWQDATAGQDDVFDYRYGAEESSTGNNRACNGTFGRASDRARNDCGTRLAARATAFRYVLFAGHNRKPLQPGQFVAGAGVSRRLILMTPEPGSESNATVRGGYSMRRVRRRNRVPRALRVEHAVP